MGNRCCRAWAWDRDRMGRWRKQGGLTVTDDVNGNEPLLDRPPTTVELHAPQAFSTTKNLQLIISLHACIRSRFASVLPGDVSGSTLQLHCGISALQRGTPAH